MPVNTVTGPIEARDLGRTLPHEHLLADRKRVSGQQDHVVRDERLAVVELSGYAALGGRTIVDLTLDDFGRDPLALRRVSEATDVQIVMGAGWYHQRYYPELVDATPTDALAELLVGEFRDGVRDTGVRPGIIGEIGSGEIGPWISAQEERVLRAAARAQRQVDCPLSTHAFGSRVGWAQLELLREEGVDPRRIVIGHADSVDDPDFHEAIARTGAWVQFDLMRQRSDWDVDIQVRLVREMVDRGHADRLLLSHDVCARSHLKAYGGMGYTALWERYRERLLAGGVPAELLDRITDQNPGRLFG